MARRPREREQIYLDGGRRTTQLMRDSLGAITNTMFTSTFRYSRPFLRRAYARRLWQTQGGFLVSMPLLLGVAIWAALDQTYSWFAGLLVGGVLVYLWILYMGYGQMRLWAGREIHVTLTDTGIRFESKFMTSEVLWSGFRTPSEQRDQIELISRDGLERRWLLPREAFSSEARDFMMRKVREASTGAT